MNSDRGNPLVSHTSTINPKPAKLVVALNLQGRRVTFEKVMENRLFQHTVEEAHFLVCLGCNYRGFCSVSHHSLLWLLD